MANELHVLLRTAEQSGEDAILNELVHDTAQEVGMSVLNEIADPAGQGSHLSAIEAAASEINNGGFERQIEYLLKAGVAQQAIEEAIRAGPSD